MKKQDIFKGIDIEYTKCFSESLEDSHTIKFRDEKLRDMYMHNFMYIKKPVDLDVFKHLYDLYKEERKREGFSYLRLEFDFQLDKRWLDIIDNKYEVNRYYYMSIDPLSYENFKENGHCDVKKAVNDRILSDGMYADIEANKAEMGLDFVERRYIRKEEVYRDNPNLFLYVSYLNDKPVGKCEMFEHDGVIKIEDFDVMEAFQRKGIGSTILKQILFDAFNRDIREAYLMVEEDNSAFEMYKKCGFVKVGEKTEMIISF